MFFVDIVFFRGKTCDELNFWVTFVFQVGEVVFKIHTWVKCYTKDSLIVSFFDCLVIYVDIQIRRKLATISVMIICYYCVNCFFLVYFHAPSFCICCFLESRSQANCSLLWIFRFFLLLVQIVMSSANTAKFTFAFERAFLTLILLFSSLDLLIVLCFYWY